MGEITINGATLEYEVEASSKDAKAAMRYVAVVGARDVQGYIEIPAEIEGLPVKRIGGLAFGGCGELTGVTIPDSVVCICESAFAYNPMLTCVKIPPSVKVIGECAFAGCGGLRRMDIPEGVMWVGFSAFIMCYSLVSVTIPSTLESIPKFAFANCNHLLHVTIPQGVRDVDKAAFSECIRLESMTMPDSVMRIGEGAFQGCWSLSSVSLPRHLDATQLKSAFVSCSPEFKISYRDQEEACVAAN